MGSTTPAYWCPQCERYFDNPSRFVSDCCGHDVVTNADDELTCVECGSTVEDDRAIPQCPYCGNTGGGRYIQPDFVECHKGNIEVAAAGGEGVR